MMDSALFLSWTASAVLSALPQDPAPTPFVAKDAVVVVQIDGPAALRTAFAQTRLAKALRAQAIAQAWAPLSKEIDEVIAEARKEAPFDLDLVLRILDGYSGRATLALHLDAQHAAGPEPGFPGVVVIALAGDGSSDLAGIGETLRKASEGSGAKGLRDLKAGDVVLRVATEDEIEFTLPAMVEGQLVSFVGGDLEKRVPRLLALRPAEGHLPTEDQRAKGLHAFVDGKAFLRLLLQLAEENGTDLPMDPATLFAALGCDTVRDLHVHAAPAGEHLLVRVSLGYEGTPRGLTAIYAAEDAGAPHLLPLVPRALPLWSVSPFRIREMFAMVAGVWDLLGDTLPMSREDGERKFAEFFKVRLREDLLAHLGDEMLSVVDAGAMAAGRREAEDAGRGGEDPFAELSGVALALELRDAKAFGASFERLIRSRGLHTARKREEYQGQTVFAQRILGSAGFEYAITDRVFVIGIGNAGARGLRAILDEEAARKAGQPPAEMHPDIHARLALCPKGYEGITCYDLRAYADMFQHLPAEGPTEGAILKAFQNTLEALSASGLQRLVSVSYHEKGRLLAYTVW